MVVQIQEQSCEKEAESSVAKDLNQFFKDEEEESVDIREVEEILGYNFKHNRLVQLSLTHSSFYYPLDFPEKTYKRLEFVGIYILGSIVGCDLYFKYPDHMSGDLTKLRSANLDNEKLARIALGNGLQKFIRHKIFEFDSQIKNFEDEIVNYPTHSWGQVDSPKILADVVEALLGAVFIDSNCRETVSKVFYRLAEPLIDMKAMRKQPKVELKELCDKHGMKLLLKNTWKQNCRVDVMIDGDFIGGATYSHKRDIAINRAAKVALDKLQVQPKSSSMVKDKDLDQFNQDEEEELVDTGAVEEILGYNFKDSHLVQLSLTSGCYYYPLDLPGKTYNRLEFVGDSVLGGNLARDLYVKYPKHSPRDLSRLLSANVDNEKLSRVALANGLQKFIRHKISDFDSQIKNFEEEVIDYPTQSYGLVNSPKILANTVESLIGAVFIDSNSMETVSKVFYRLAIAEPLISMEMLRKPPKVELQEFCIKQGIELAYRDTWKKNKRVDVMINGLLYGSATYSMKGDIAVNRAAKVALDNIRAKICCFKS